MLKKLEEHLLFVVACFGHRPISIQKYIYLIIKWAHPIIFNPQCK